MLNPNLVRRTLDSLKRQIIEHDKEPGGAARRCSELAVFCQVRLAYVLLYAMRDDVLGPLPELVKTMESQNALYQYDDFGGFEEWDDLKVPFVHIEEFDEPEKNY